MATMPALNWKKIQAYADWRLLAFLVLFLDVKLAVKIPALLAMCALQPDFKLGLSLKNSRLPLFYPVIIALAIISWGFNRSLHVNYLMVLITGIGFWLLCLISSHQVKKSVEQHNPELIHRTLLIFFAANALVSFLNLGIIIFKTGALNPYLYQGEYQKYFIGTGDYIRGLTFDTSTTNAIINAFGVIYFLTRKNGLLVCLCMSTLVLTGSNLVDILLIVILLVLFIFRSNRNQKSLIVVCLALLAVFMGKVSPQNNHYMVGTFADLFRHHRDSVYLRKPAEQPVTTMPDSLLSPDQRREKIARLYLDSVSTAKLRAFEKAETKKQQPAAIAVNKPAPVVTVKNLELPKPDINSAPYQSRSTIDDEQKMLLGFIDLNKNNLPISGHEFFNNHRPGKVIGFLQTIRFMRQHPAKLLTGTGVGNFASKLAFRASGLGFSGGFPSKYVYINPAFLSNHLDIYLNFFSKRFGLHSITNSPNSTYDQLLAEYGIIGLLAFLVAYLGFFARHYKTLTYGLPLLVLMAGVFFVDYWFEQLSVLILFELMLYLNIKETTMVKPATAVPNDL